MRRESTSFFKQLRHRPTPPTTPVAIYQSVWGREWRFLIRNPNPIVVWFDCQATVVRKVLKVSYLPASSSLVVVVVAVQPAPDFLLPPSHPSCLLNRHQTNLKVSRECEECALYTQGETRGDTLENNRFPLYSTARSV